MKKDLEKQIKEKEKQREALLKKYDAAKKKGEESKMLSIVAAGKALRVDLELLKRRLKALSMGLASNTVQQVNPLANVKPLTKGVRRKRKSPVRKPDNMPIVPRPYKDD